jgi:hypothetical protein
MTKLVNRCAQCGGRFGLISHSHWGLRFCRKACKKQLIAKASKDRARVRKWFGFLALQRTDGFRKSCTTGW